MDELFNIIGKLYVEIYNTQRVLEMTRQQLQDKDNEIDRLQQQIPEGIDE